MFDELLLELENMNENDRNSCCILGLERCAFVVEVLFRDMEHERRRLLEGTSRLVGVNGSIPASSARGVRQALDEFEVNQSIDALAHRLLGRKKSLLRGASKAQFLELCREYSETAIPIRERIRMLLRLMNQLTFRLYGVTAAEAEQIGHETEGL